MIKSTSGFHGPPKNLLRLTVAIGPLSEEQFEENDTSRPDVNFIADLGWFSCLHNHALRRKIPVGPGTLRCQVDGFPKIVLVHDLGEPEVCYFNLSGLKE